jgi:competence protein ComEC
MRLVYAACAWSAGIFCSASFQNAIPSAWWMSFAALTALMLRLKTHIPRWMWILGVVFCAGGLRFALHPAGADIQRWIDGAGLTLIGQIADEPFIQGDHFAARFKPETVLRGGREHAVSGDVLIHYPLFLSLELGDRVQATGILSDPGIIDTFSYRDYLARFGIYALMRSAAVEQVEQGIKLGMFGWLTQLRRESRTRIGAALPEPAASLLIGMVLGDESGIAPEVESAFNDTGAAHVIAISGYNMVVFSGLIVWLIGALAPARRRLGSLLGVAVIALYTALVGGGAGVERAALMCGLILIGGALRRRTFLPASLAFAAIILSLDNPTVFWDISFQYSFLAVVGMALFTDPLMRLGARFVPARWVVEPLAVSAAAQALTIPLAALYFQRVSLVTLPVNLLIAPVLPLIITFGTAAALMTVFIPFIGVLLLWAVLPPLLWLIGVVRAAGALPFAALSVYPDAALTSLILLFILALGAAPSLSPDAWTRLTQRALQWLAVGGGIGLLMLFALLWVNRSDGLLHIWLWDGGSLIQTPGGAHVLVDGGRFPARLLTILGDHQPFYKRRIDLWLLTQPDERRYAAVPEALARYEIGAALYNGQPNLSPAYRRLFEGLADDPVVAVRAGYSVEFSDGVQIDVLHPESEPTITDRIDDGALVFRLTYNHGVFLFPSDLSVAGQIAMLRRQQAPAVTLLQTPGSGAPFSIDRDWLQALSPQVVVAVGSPDAALAASFDAPLFIVPAGEVRHLWTDGVTLWIDPDRR